MELKIGDNVRVVGESSFSGETGTVEEIIQNGMFVMVSVENAKGDVIRIPFFPEELVKG